MADWSQAVVPIQPPVGQTEDPHEQVEVTVPGSGGGAPVISFKMRAEKDPGPGYEVWVVTGSPDFLGTSAGGPIIVGTAVVVSEW